MYCVLLLYSLHSNDKMDNSMALQELIEKVTLLRRAIKLKHKDVSNVENTLLSQQLRYYYLHVFCI